MKAPTERRPLQHEARKPSILTLPIRFLVGLVLVADTVARPLYRPLLDRIASWKITEAFERQVARLPRLAILVLFAVPFAIAEPLKVFALLLMASGKIVVGLPLLVFSYLVTFLLVERIYHVGREKLLSYGWFHLCMTYVWALQGRLKAVKDEAMSTIRSWLSRAGI